MQQIDRLLNLKRGLQVTATLALAIVTSVLPAVSAHAASSISGQRSKEIQAAAQEFKVPESILSAVAYNQSRWEDHDGQPSVDGGYGPMHLVTAFQPQDHRGDPSRPIPAAPVSNGSKTLDEAATLLGLSPETLKSDPAQNIRGGAALLAKYAKEAHNNLLPTSTDDWYGAVAKFGGLDQASAKSFADDVFATIQKGAQGTTTDGQALLIAPQAVKPQTDELKILSLPTAPQLKRSSLAECPTGLDCRFVPAYNGQNNPTNPADYGNYDPANRPQDSKIRYIVIHDTEGSYQSSIDWFQNPASYVAAHYLIRSSDGQITQMVRTSDVAWQAGNWYMNTHSIGIEHEGFAAEGGSWYTEAMYKSSAKLVRYLADKYGIPLDRQHIIGHEEVPGLTPARQTTMHTDPGPYWDWAHYFDLLHAPIWGSDNTHAPVVTIAPKYATNQPPVSTCTAQNVCTDLPAHGSSFVYLRTAPAADAPLLSDPALHSDGSAGTTKVEDTSARALFGRKYAVAQRQGDWTAIWFGGQKGWFYNPSVNHTAKGTWARRITPKNGAASVPVYGRPTPEASAFPATIPALTLTPLQYSIPAGQQYTTYGPKTPTDYFYAMTFDRSLPDDGSIVMGHDRFYPISFNHRQAFVKASDVQVVE